MRTTTPNTLPKELPVVHFERKAERLRREEGNRLLQEALNFLLRVWTGSEARIARAPRQQAMHPDHPKAEALRELGLERFLTPAL